MPSWIVMPWLHSARCPGDNRLFGTVLSLHTWAWSSTDDIIPYSIDSNYPAAELLTYNSHTISHVLCAHAVAAGGDHQLIEGDQVGEVHRSPRSQFPQISQVNWPVVLILITGEASVTHIVIGL